MKIHVDRCRRGIELSFSNTGHMNVDVENTIKNTFLNDQMIYQLDLLNEIDLYVTQ